MRIISGKHKGRRLVAPKNLPVRPTTDICKEALFNILNNHFNFSNLKILDLFAGTGNISFEFASRGAAPIYCVDADTNCINFIKKITSDLDFEIQTIKSDVFSFLEKNKTTYDLIFADPPYDLDMERFEKMIQIIFNNGLLEQDGMLIIEHSKHTKLENCINFSFSRTYGGSVFSFFELEPIEEEESTDFSEEEED